LCFWILVGIGVVVSFSQDLVYEGDGLGVAPEEVEFFDCMEEGLGCRFGELLLRV